MNITRDNGVYACNIEGPLGARIDRELNAFNDRDDVRAEVLASRPSSFRLPGYGEEDAERDWQSWLEMRVERISAGFRVSTKTTPSAYRGAALEALLDDQQPEIIRRWAQDGESKTLILHGPPGTGKTFAAYALLNDAAVVYGLDRKAPGVKTWAPTGISVAALLDRLRGDGDEAFWEQVKGSELLLLDDLGLVRTTEWAIERMWMLADARCADGRRTIVTTNAGFNDLAEVWSLATMDRFRDKCVTAKFTGTSLRKPVTW